MAKKALIVGINYVGTGNDLKGCLNDAYTMQALLRDHYGFTDINMVLEQYATTAGMKAALQSLVAGSQPGDTLVFHYSGHGSRVPAYGQDVEADGYDEIICPFDLDWQTKIITDDYLKAIFDQAPNGVNLTVVLDCCHSGTGLDQAEQYQPFGGQKATMQKMGMLDEGSKYIAPPVHLEEQMKTMQRRTWLMEQGTRDVNKTVLMIAGCEDDQTSADAFIDGTYCGAATYSLCKALVDAKYSLSYKSLIEKMNDYMLKNGYSQRPELNGPSALFAKNFLGEFGVAATPNDPVIQPPAPSVVETVTTTVAQVSKTKYWPFIIAAVAAAVMAIVVFVLN